MVKFLVALTSLIFASGCALNSEKQINLVADQNDLQLCHSYLAEYDILFSTDIASLNEGKKKYLIDLLYQINLHGLTKPICKRMINKSNQQA